MEEDEKEESAYSRFLQPKLNYKKSFVNTSFKLQD